MQQDQMAEGLEHFFSNPSKQEDMEKNMNIVQCKANDHMWLHYGLEDDDLQVNIKLHNLEKD